MRRGEGCGEPRLNDECQEATGDGGCVKLQNEPVVLYPAITCDSPLMMESFENLKMKIIRPNVPVKDDISHG